MNIEAEPDYSDAWFTELASYLSLMYHIEMQTSRSDPLFDTFLAAAGRDGRLFSDLKWQDGYQQMIDSMTTAGKMISDARPSEALMEVHLLFIYAQTVYTIRTLHAAKALDYFRRSQFGQAAQELEHFKEATFDLARMAQERQRILNPADQFASLRGYIAQKKLERARVAAEQA